MFDVWKNVLAEIEQQISPANYSTWFAETSLLSTEDGEIKIGVKNSFHIKQLKTRYLDMITTALKNNNVPIKNISFEIKSLSKPKTRSREVFISNEVLKNRLKKIQKTNKESSAVQQTGLNNKYTLANFVVGSNNDLAVSAAKSMMLLELVLIPSSFMADRV